MTKKKKSIWILADVGLALALFLIFKKILADSGFGIWQTPIFGSPILTSTLLFFVLPVLITRITRNTNQIDGCNFSNWKNQLRIGTKAIAFIAPATALFPVIALLGSTHQDWLGASILAAGFLITGWLFAVNSSKLPITVPENVNNKDLGISIVIIVGGVVVCYLANLVNPLLTRIVSVLVFVAFMEEFFFRGYVQSRLNEYFGKRFTFQRVEFGMGLVITAIIFGLFHPLTAIGETPWPWAIWTAAFGLIAGFVREKSGSFVTSAILHGVIILPAVFFGPG